MIVNIKSLPGSGKLSKHGKKFIAQQMYHNGKGFIGASILLNKQRAFHSVTKHLLLQGIENTSKGGLLLINYDKYKPLLKFSKKKSGSIGHSLEIAFKHFETEFPKLKSGNCFNSEIRELNKYYQRHFFRYGGFVDIFTDFNSLKHNWTMKMVDKIVNIMDAKML